MNTEYDGIAREKKYVFTFTKLIFKYEFRAEFFSTLRFFASVATDLASR